MKNYLVKAFLSVSLLFLFHVSFAGDKNRESELTFNEEEVKANGINLSDLGLLKDGLKDSRIINNAAVRYETHYAPASPLDGEPFNLPLTEIQRHVDRAHAVLKKVKDSDMFTTALKGKNITLPLGIKKMVGNAEIVVCLDSLVLTPRYAYAVLYVVIEDKKNNKTLAFWGKDIRFTKAGGLTGDARLELLQTYDLQFGEKIKASFLVDATHQNYVVFNCDGFKHLHVDARVFFAREMFLPENADGTIKRTGQVTADFMTDLEGFDDWMVQISNVPSFQVVGLEGTSFALRNITFDRSSLANPSGIVFPTDYTYPGFAPGVSPNMWEGFYIVGLTVKLPKEFKLKDNSTQRISMSVEKALIDKLGFTGTVAVNNLLGMGDVKMINWDYSLDYVGVKLLKSTPTEALFRGKLKIPINSENEFFNYSATILPDQHYNFTVSNSTKLSFPIWGMAKVDIYPESYIKVDVVNSDFTPKAMLSGKCFIGAELNNPRTGINDTSKVDNSLTLASVTFQKLVITATTPYLDIAPGGGVSLGGSSQRMAKMPVCVDEIGLVKGEAGSEKVGLRVALRVNLLGTSDPGTFAAGATVSIWGKREPTTNKWNYNSTTLNRIFIDVKISAVKLKGEIVFYRDDVIYGSGFSGKIAAKLCLADTIGLESNVLFGKKKKTDSDDIFRYWYVDANVELGTARIPAVGALLYINSIGLGAYYRLEPNTDGVSSTMFTTKNGVSYLPNQDKGLGLKAMLGIEGTSKKIVNGDLGLEMCFDTDGSLSNIVFTGMVQFVSLKDPGGITNMAAKYKELQKKTKVTSLLQQKNTATKPEEVNAEISKKPTGAIMAEWKMEFNKAKKEFSATVDLYVNVFNVIIGSNGANKAGTLDVYCGPAKSYFRVGTPSAPMAVSVLDALTGSTYFVAGDDLPAPMPMPNGHSSEFTDQTKQDAGLGKGFGMGARLSVNVKVGSGVYVFVEGGAGADLFVFNEGPVYCSTIEKNRGVNDWYMFGQAYVYVRAGVGIDVCIPWIHPTCKCCRRWWCPYWCCWETTQICAHKEWSAQLGIFASFQGVKPVRVEIDIPNPLKSDASIKIGKKCN